MAIFEHADKIWFVGGLNAPPTYNGFTTPNLVDILSYILLHIIRESNYNMDSLSLYWIYTILAGYNITKLLRRTLLYPSIK